MEDGRWRMEDGGWRMEDAGCRMEDAGCRMQDAGCRMEDGGWRMQDAGWRMEDAGCRMQDGSRPRLKHITFSGVDPDTGTTFFSLSLTMSGCFFYPCCAEGRSKIPWSRCLQYLVRQNKMINIHNTPSPQLNIKVVFTLSSRIQKTPKHEKCLNVNDASLLSARPR